MATVNDLLDRLQYRGYGFDTEDAQLLALETAQSTIDNYRRWSFNDRNEIVPLPAGQSNISLETDLVGEVRFLDAVRVVGGSELEFMPYQQFRHWSNSIPAASGAPERWTRHADEVLVWPVPTETIQLSVDYNERAPRISTLDPATDQLAAPAPYEELIVLGAIRDLAFRERDWDARAAAQQDYAQLLADFTAEHGVQQRQTSDRVVASGFFEAYGV